MQFGRFMSASRYIYGFAAAFRCSELVGLDVSDLEAHPRGQLVTIRRSKTDQAAQGQSVAVLAQPGSPWCLVAALATWQDAAGITTDPRSASSTGAGVSVSSDSLRPTSLP